MTAAKLTPREARALDAFRRCLLREGIPPTLQEWAAELGLTEKSSVFPVARVLVAKGLLRHFPGKARAYRPALAVQVADVRCWPAIDSGGCGVNPVKTAKSNFVGEPIPPVSLRVVGDQAIGDES